MIRKLGSYKPPKTVDEIQEKIKVLAWGYEYLVGLKVRNYGYRNRLKYHNEQMELIKTKMVELGRQIEQIGFQPDRGGTHYSEQGYEHINVDELWKQSQST